MISGESDPRLPLMGIHQWMNPCNTAATHRLRREIWSLLIAGWRYSEGGNR